MERGGCSTSYSTETRSLCYGMWSSNEFVGLLHLKTMLNCVLTMSTLFVTAESAFRLTVVSKL